ncbi:hypothetical protein M231_01345 [Tremella mesenterica]|uniref:COP9 signalosome complex subunit 3 n=1 Tax=Tremella mesenterica TaxID=5217 RepID=A0A4Q1BTN0_TREME|nr:hypothetical protein M231_01345 [Tremella mesenterica]
MSPVIPSLNNMETLIPFLGEYTQTGKLERQIKASDTITSIEKSLIPLLDKMRQADLVDTDEILACREFDISILSSEDLNRMTAGLLYILEMRLKTVRRGTQASDIVYNDASRLCQIADTTQLVLCQKQVVNFVNAFYNFLESTPLSVIEPLTNLIQNHPPNVLTPIHHIFLEACLSARLNDNFDVAMPIINHIYLDTKLCHPTYLDVISFYHHAGLICAARQEFSKAVGLFNVAVTIPTSAASAIQLVSAKRAMLCNLLSTGKKLHFPRYTSSAVTRLLERYAQAYEKISKSFDEEDWSGVLDHSQDKLFDEDYNRGLINQLINSIIPRKILKLDQTYSRLTIPQLLQKLSLDSEDQLLSILDQMIQSNSLHVQISHPSKSITFLPPPLPSPKQLLQTAQMSSYLSIELNNINSELGIRPDYLKRIVKELEKGKHVENVIAPLGLRGVGNNMSDIGF